MKKEDNDIWVLVYDRGNNWGLRKYRQPREVTMKQLALLEMYKTDAWYIYKKGKPMEIIYSKRKERILIQEANKYL